MEITTALEGCDRYCPNFQVEQRELYRNGDIFYREFRCENLEKCLALLEVMMKEREKHER